MKRVQLFKRLNIPAQTRNNVFPVGLQMLASQLVPDWRYSAEGFLLNNSLLPFYKPFTPPERYLLWQQMAYENPEKLGQALGYAARRYPLKCCISCLADDVDEKRELHFRRTHQLVGCEACHVHGTLLTTLEGDGRVVKFKVPEDYGLDMRQKPRPAHPALVTLAKDLHFVPQSLIDLDLKQSDESLLIILREAGFVTRTAKCQFELAKKVKGYLGTAQEKLPPILRGRPSEGDGHLSRDPRVIEHPFRQLVLLRAIGASPSELGKYRGPPSIHSSYPTRTAHLGACRNPLCGCKGLRVIRPRRMFVNRHFRLLVFQCQQCCFTYVREVSDEEGNFVHSRCVLSFGKEWMQKFTEVWMNPEYNYAQIVKTLGFARSSSFYFLAAELAGLPLDRGGLSIYRQRLRMYLAIKEKERSLIILARKKLAGTQKTSSGVDRRRLIELCPQEYHLLVEYDCEWLEEFLGRHHGQ